MLIWRSLISCKNYFHSSFCSSGNLPRIGILLCKYLMILLLLWERVLLDSTLNFDHENCSPCFTHKYLTFIDRGKEKLISIVLCKSLHPNNHYSIATIILNEKFGYVFYILSMHKLYLSIQLYGLIDRKDKLHFLSSKVICHCM